MAPKILGIVAPALAVGFILALPTMFEGEPADEVEPIRFGPPPVMKLADARRVAKPVPSRPVLAAPQPVAVPPPLASPVAVPSRESSGGIPGKTADTGPIRPAPTRTGEGGVTSGGNGDDDAGGGGNEAQGDDDESEDDGVDAGDDDDADGDDGESWDDDGDNDDEGEGDD